MLGRREIWFSDDVVVVLMVVEGCIIVKKEVMLFI